MGEMEGGMLFSGGKGGCEGGFIGRLQVCTLGGRPRVSSFRLWPPQAEVHHTRNIVKLHKQAKKL